MSRTKGTTELENSPASPAPPPTTASLGHPSSAPLATTAPSPPSMPRPAPRGHGQPQWAPPLTPHAHPVQWVTGLRSPLPPSTPAPPAPQGPTRTPQGQLAVRSAPREGTLPSLGPPPRGIAQGVPLGGCFAPWVPGPPCSVTPGILGLGQTSAHRTVRGLVGLPPLVLAAPLEAPPLTMPPPPAPLDTIARVDSQPRPFPATCPPPALGAPVVGSPVAGAAASPPPPPAPGMSPPSWGMAPPRGRRRMGWVRALGCGLGIGV